VSLSHARYAAAIRVAWGVVFLLRTTHVIALGWSLPSGPLLGWPEQGLRFVHPAIALPSAALALVCIVRTIAAASFLFGVATRPAGVTAGLLGYVTLTQDELALSGSLHLLFLGTIVLALARDRSLIRVLVVSIYAWAFVAKMSVEWLNGNILVQLIEDSMIRGTFAAFLRDASMRVAVAWLVAIGELGLALGLSWRRTRQATLIAAVAMHICFQIGIRPDSMGLEMFILLAALAGDYFVVPKDVQPPLLQPLPQ
jgi:hypothetical protein